MDRIGTLATFLQVAETRSFTAAARQTGVSASAVGKTIARLEDRLGVRLFHRSTRSVTLTVEGALFLERSRRIVSEIEAAELELSQSRDAPSGRLRVSLPLIGMLMMPPIMGFMRAYPAIELDLDFTDRMVDVIEEGFDVVVRTGEARDSRLMMRGAGSFAHAIVASPVYLAGRGTPIVPEDLARHACLHHRYPSTGRLERWPLVRGGADLDLALPVTAVASTLEPQICMAEEGFGLACLPRFAVRRQLERGTLVAVLDGHLRVASAFHILWPASRHPAPKVSAFVAFMAENLLKEPTGLGCGANAAPSAPSSRCAHRRGSSGD